MPTFVYVASLAHADFRVIQGMSKRSELIPFTPA